MREARQLRAAARAATRSAARRPTPAINDLWLQERGHLLPVRRHVHGRQRRRHRRLRGADAPPHLVHDKEARAWYFHRFDEGPWVRKPVEQYEMLRSLRAFLQWRVGDSIILAEANVLPEADMEYFGKDGDRSWPRRTRGRSPARSRPPCTGPRPPSGVSSCATTTSWTWAGDGARAGRSGAEVHRLIYW